MIEAAPSILDNAKTLRVDTSWIQSYAPYIAALVTGLFALIAVFVTYSLKEGSRLAKRVQILDAATKEVDFWVKILTAEKDFIAFSWTKDGPHLTDAQGKSLAQKASVEFEAIYAELAIALPKTPNRFTQSTTAGFRKGVWFKGIKLPRIAIAGPLIRFVENLWSETWKMVWGVLLNILRIILVLCCIAELALWGGAIYYVIQQSKIPFSTPLILIALSSIGLFSFLVWTISKIGDALERLAL